MDGHGRRNTLPLPHMSALLRTDTVSDYSHNIRRRILAGDEPSWITNHPRRVYLVNLILATPYWVDQRTIRALKREAKRRTAVSGRYFVVDHIIPVTHKLVCGLNVPWNMRIITGTENAQRSNRWWEWTDDMFSEPQQLPLW